MDTNFSTEEFLNSLAGINGTIEWKGFKPVGEENPNIIVVEANLFKDDKDENNHNLRLQFLFNKNTGITQLAYVELDDEAKPIMGMWALEFFAFDF